MYKYIIFFFVTSLVVIACTRVASAYFQAPPFPTCPNPGGSIIADYNSGLHGIAGQDNLVSGSDSVYSLDSDMTQVVQCYCPQDMSNGVQTNWLDVKDISADDKASLESQGWIFEPDGSAWGLANDPYMAQNSGISCGTTSTPSSQITAVVQASDQTNGQSSSNSNANPSVHTLPGTGGSAELLLTILIGVVSLGIGVLLRKFTN